MDSVEKAFARIHAEAEERRAMERAGKKGLMI